MFSSAEPSANQHRSAGGRSTNTTSHVASRAAPGLGRGNHMRVAVLDDQDSGDARWGSCVCGECTSYEPSPQSGEYSTTALETSLPKASTPMSPSSRSSDRHAIGSADSEEITGGVR